MPTPTTNQLLKLANLQLGAESLFGFKATTLSVNLQPGDKFRHKWGQTPFSSWARNKWCLSCPAFLGHPS